LTISAPGRFQQAMHGKLPDGWDRDIPAFPPDTKGHGDSRCCWEGHECRCASIAGTDRRFGGFESIDPYRTFGVGDFEPAGVTVLDKQGAVDGVWSYAGRNLHFGVREHGMGGDPERFGGARRRGCRSARHF